MTERILYVPEAERDVDVYLGVHQVLAWLETIPPGQRQAAMKALRAQREAQVVSLSRELAASQRRPPALRGGRPR